MKDKDKALLMGSKVSVTKKFSISPSELICHSFPVNNFDINIHYSS
jgi:hypothetical protein